VERTFSWLSKNRRIRVRTTSGLCVTSETFVFYVAMIRLAMTRLIVRGSSRPRFIRQLNLLPAI
jgi:hypothetical protein